MVVVFDFSLSTHLLSMSLAEKQVQTAQTFIEGLRSTTVEGFLIRRSKDCIHKTRPASMQVPDKNNVMFEDQYRHILPLLKNYQVSISSKSQSVQLLLAVLPPRASIRSGV